MTDSANLKIRRATEHINALHELFLKKRPFTYVLETNTVSGKRSTFAKKNEAVIESAALICGDGLHNLRSALDHAFREIVSPHATPDRERKALQFPFAESEARLVEMLARVFAKRVSQNFYRAILDLKPHGDSGGNELLYLIHKLDIVDKHRLLIPTADYKTISSQTLSRQVPDFPKGVTNFTVGGSHRDVVWSIPPMNRADRRRLNIPSSGVHERELNVPVEIVFEVVGLSQFFQPVIPTLRRLIGVVETAVQSMRRAVT